MSSSLQQLQAKPALFAAVAVAAGAGATLLATHLTNAWCPVAGTSARGPVSGCPVTGNKSSTCPFSRSTPSKKPLVVTVTGAAGQIGYAILFQIAQGRMLGADQPVELRLLDLPHVMDALKGVEMELADCAFPLLTKVVCTSEYKAAFENCDVALLIGARPRGPGMSRADLLKANADIFKKQGAALNEFASRNVKVLVVGNPANTNAKIAMEHAPNLPKTAWTAMTRLDEIRAVNQLAVKAGVSVGCVKNVVVWGNHSDTQYPDITFASVEKDGKTQKASDLVPSEWAQGSFINTVQARGSAIIEAMKKSSAASAANAAVEHVRSWMLGTAPGQFVSMAVCSSGEYGVPADLIFSFPCTCKNGVYTIVPDLEISAFGKEKMRVSWEQLQKEDQGWRAEAPEQKAE